MSKIKVTMSERVEYEVDVDVAEFVELVGLDPVEGETLQGTVDRLRSLVVENPDEDYGVEGADELLEHVLEIGHETGSVSERQWEFDFTGTGTLPPEAAGIRAPEHAPDWDD